MLPGEDREFLSKRFPGFIDLSENQMWCVVLPEFRLPEGLTEPASDLLIRLAPGYPDIPPDMWWFCPAVQRIDDQTIPQADVYEQYLAALVAAPSPGHMEAGNRYHRELLGNCPQGTALRRGLSPPEDARHEHNPGPARFSRH